MILDVYYPPPETFFMCGVLCLISSLYLYSRNDFPPNLTLNFYRDKIGA